MNGFDRLGRELDLAARAPRTRPWSRRAAGAGGALAIGVALASVAVIAVGAVVLLHGRRASAPASSAQPAPAAQSAAWARVLSCAPVVHPPLSRVLGRPVMSKAAPSPALLALLGALRGRWTAADAAPSGTCAGLGSALLPGGSIDVAYVRYAGPGLRGGKVFLVPATLNAPSLPPGVRGWTAYAPARVKPEPAVCLLTIGGASPGIGQCVPRQEVERPFPLAFAPSLSPPGFPARMARQVCGPQRAARARAVCVHALLHPHFAAPVPTVVSGVVRDGIATVDVYTRSGRKVLAAVPVRDNVYAFRSGGALTGVLELVFRDAGGRAVDMSPVHFGTASVSATASVGPALVPLTTATRASAP